MAIDLKKSYSDALEDISAIKTVNQTIKSEKKLKKENIKSPDYNKDKSVTQINSSPNSDPLDKKTKNLKSNSDSLLEKMFDIFSQTNDGKSTDNETEDSGEKSVKELRKDLRKARSTDTISRIFLETAVNTKEKVKNLIIKEIINTIGCSQDESYDAISNTNAPIYIKIKNIDFFDILKYSPNDEYVKYAYELTGTTNGTFPYSMNRELFNRLITPSSFSQQYGTAYIGASGNQIFDIQYELVSGVQYFKVTLLQQQNNQSTVSAFLNDYFQSIDVFNIDNLIGNILNKLFSTLDTTNETPDSTLITLEKFFKIIKRLMGVCSDPSQRIEVAGTAKISDDEELSDDFFTVSDIELREIEQKVDNIQNGLISFVGCDNVLLPNNPVAVNKSLNQIISEQKNEKKIDLLLKNIGGLSKDPNWSKSIGGLNILDFILKEMVLDLPTLLIKTIFSPKMMLGFMIMFKAIKTSGINTLNEYYDGLLDFIKKFKKIMFRLSKDIVAIFIEELFKAIKKNIKILVEDILLGIITERTNKYFAMYSTIVYSLLQLSQAFIDFKNCKNVIDEILKLLNLGLKSVGGGLPLFILAAASQLDGVSDTRAFSNTIKNLQKAGLPTGPNADGTPNLMNIAMKSQIKGQHLEQFTRGKSEIFIPSLTITPAGITLPSKGVGKSY